MNLIEKEALKKAVIKEYNKAIRYEKKDEGKFVVIVMYSQNRRLYFIEECFTNDLCRGSKNRADAYLFTSYKKAREIAEKVGGKVKRV